MEKEFCLSEKIIDFDVDVPDNVKGFDIEDVKEFIKRLKRFEYLCPKCKEELNDNAEGTFWCEKCDDSEYYSEEDLFIFRIDKLAGEELKD